MKSRPGLLRSCLRIHNNGQELLEAKLIPRRPGIATM